MNILETDGIILSSLKHGDTSLILKVFTLNYGISSFIVKGVFSKKNRQSAIYFPLSELRISFSKKSNQQQLLFLKTAHVNHYFKTIHCHPVKSASIFFLAEFLGLILKTEEENKQMYFFIKDQLQVFDEKDHNFSDFHLTFLLKFSFFLGFYPNIDLIHYPLFDLKNGSFTHFKTSEYMLTEQETSLFKQLLFLEFSEFSTHLFNQQSRNQLLDILILYYRIHIENFKQPKSLSILQQLFH